MGLVRIHRVSGIWISRALSIGCEAGERRRLTTSLSSGAAECSARAPLTLLGRAVITVHRCARHLRGRAEHEGIASPRVQTPVALSPRSPVTECPGCVSTGLCPAHIVPSRRGEPAHTCKEKPQKLNNESISLESPIVSLLAKRLSLTCPWLQTSGAETNFTGGPAPVSDCGGKEARALALPLWQSEHGCPPLVLPNSLDTSGPW